MLDASRSMFRTDYSPNRLEACKSAILHFIQSRMTHDSVVGSSSAYSVVVISDAAKKVFDFTDSASYDQIASYFADLTCHGRSALGEGVGMAIKILIEDIRTNGARSPKIIIFSDGKYTNSKVDPIKMANLSQQLGIKMDTIRVGDVEHFSILKQLADTTGGKYSYANNAAIILNYVAELATSNMELPSSTPRKSKEKVSAKVLKKIAAPLLDENEMNRGTEDQKGLIERLRGTKSYERCSICFQPNDPYSKTSFSISGRFCPNCGTPMHTTCASMWAKNQDKEGDGTIFRCVHCLYLLQIPASVQTAVRMHQSMMKTMKGTQSDKKSPQSYSVSTALASSFGEEAMYSACPVCDGIFEEKDEVLKCGNPDCNAIYHSHCFDKLSNHTCKSCGSKMTRLFQ
ncbi:VWA domain-containing protein [Candidatus Lokiarchaeum ossiferum]|uniref:VWA domain-containing protein n=1 Tax=Candidatus Lokiarchaeum ossiferum TaxID=2951803 RepID=UPI00352D5584